VTKYGLTLSSEEHSAPHLVDVAIAAEDAGFDFVSISDHFHPWTREQGHSPFVWSTLGAIAQATHEIGVGIGVSCPIMRIHPAVSAHAAATAAQLLGNRFTWGVGTGEALNEHILGDRWPPADVRVEMLEEAITLVRRLWEGDSVTHRGRHFTVEDARIFDHPDPPPPIVVSAFGTRSAELAAEVGDGLWMTGIQTDVIEEYHSAGGDGPIWSQLSLCWDKDRDTALKRAHRVWPNTALAGQLAQDLTTVKHIEQATQLVTREDIEDSNLPIGPDPDPILRSISAAEDAGIDHVYLHQIGDPLQGFIEFWSKNLLPQLK
jgi:coenzyme F420-dependent glucose-6-phosphate dehydrogenase